MPQTSHQRNEHSETPVPLIYVALVAVLALFLRNIYVVLGAVALYYAALYNAVRPQAPPAPHAAPPGRPLGGGPRR